jgi:hypothetical protein
MLKMKAAHYWIEHKAENPVASVRYRSSRNKGDKKLPATYTFQEGLKARMRVQNNNRYLASFFFLLPEEEAATDEPNHMTDYH